MTGNCAPTYNFYNCCDPNGGSAHKFHKFIWGTDSTPTNTQDMAGVPPDALVSSGTNLNIPPDKRNFLNLAPLPVPADLLSIHVMRFTHRVPSAPDIPPAYTAPIDFDLVVMDLMGNVLRTISTAVVDYRIFLHKVWAAIPLTANTAHLSIQPGEIVAARVLFGAADPSVRLSFQLTGVGQLI